MSGNMSILVFVIVIAGALAGNYYRLALKDSMSYSGEDLVSIDEEFTSVKWKFIAGYILLMILIIGMAIGGIVFWDIPINKIILPLIMSVSIYCSLFALVIKVYPNPSKYNLNRFIYDIEEDIRKTALIQLGIDAVVCVVGIVLL